LRERGRGRKAARAEERLAVIREINHATPVSHTDMTF